MTDQASGLYIHVPFCPAKCRHCDFYSVNAPSLHGRWLEALGREMETAGRFRDPFDTLYIGGGTPSSLSAGSLEKLITPALHHFPFAPGAEVTVEFNPEDASPEKVAWALSLGVTRISLGVQSFDDRFLKILGRRHDAGTSRRAVETIRRAGCENLSLDLIFGLPGQDLNDWRRDLDEILAYHPEHLSCYQLTLEPGTALYQAVESGRRQLPDEETLRAMFLETSEFLSRNGYRQYEVSNFSRGPGFESRHNRKYWDHTPYLGLGPAAHSFEGGRRWWNVRSVREYCRLLEEGRLPTAGEETLEPWQLDLEKLYLGLRTSRGVDLDLVLAQPGGPEAAQTWLDRSLARISGQRIVLTPAGLVVSDRLALL